MRHNPLLDQLARYPIAELQARRAEAEARGVALIDLSTGDPDEPTDASIRKAFASSVPIVSSYPSIAGSAAFRGAVAAYVERRFAVALDAATQVLPTSGSKEAVFHLPFAFVDPAADDRAVVYPSPGYPAWGRGAAFAGGEPVPVGLDEHGSWQPWALPDELLAQTRLLYVCSPHNPSGATFTAEQLRATWERCRAHDVLLVSDECYVDLYDGEPLPSLLQVATEGHLVVHSLSKRSGMTGYRSGFLAGDPEVLRVVRRLRENLGVAPSRMTLAAAITAWSDDGHVAERRAIFSEKRRVLGAMLDRLGLYASGRTAGLYLWIRLPEGWDDRAYVGHLLEHGVLLNPGSFLGEHGQGWVRAALVPEVDELPHLVHAWEAAHASFSG